VLFVCTANVLDSIPGPLLDRMEVIRLSGYIADEKVAIARRYLEPHAREGSGVAAGAAALTDGAVSSLIEDYCREAGVRNLQKQLEKIYRKVALRVVRAAAAAEGGAGPPGAAAAVAPPDAPLLIDAPQLAEYLGPPPFPTDKLYNDATPVGVVTGLAWTSMGGSTLYVECSVAERGPGKGGLRATGQLGDVMRESSEIAHTYARAFLARLRPGDTFFDEARLHVHVPAGATPKDGPSAGATLVTALLSRALGRPARAAAAMTGEVTLTGRVLPVGGIKEKTIAARRAGVATLLLPAGNRRDYEELPADVRAGMTAHFVERYEDVFALMLAQPSDAPLRPEEEQHAATAAGQPAAAQA
jgi:Lon-like ATP-dependent protease